MVRLIMGVKGSGKTKQLIELINNAAKDEPGNVVCIEANRTMTYDIHYHIRLIDAQEYNLDSSSSSGASSAACMRATMISPMCSSTTCARPSAGKWTRTPRIS